MCGRYTLRTDGPTLAETFKVDSSGQVRLIPRYNIAPTQPVPVIRACQRPSESDRRARGDGGDCREMSMVHWGLVPYWAEDVSVGQRMINARAEGITSKPAFRAAMKYRRCLIPADGFFEWKASEQTPAKEIHESIGGAQTAETGSTSGKDKGQGKGKGKNKSARQKRRPKQPFLIQRIDGNPFAFAGLWEHWQDAAGNELESCAIITGQPNDFLATLHTRMPVILHPEAYADWLNPNAHDAQAVEHLARLLGPYPADSLSALPVSRRLNNPTNDDPTLIEPIDKDQADAGGKTNNPTKHGPTSEDTMTGSKDQQQELFSDD